MKRIVQKFSVPFEYGVYFTREVFVPENKCLVELISPEPEVSVAPKCFWVIDQGVSEAHPRLLDQIKRYSDIHSAGMAKVGIPMIVTGGEKVKNEHEWVEKILNAVDQHGIDRHSYIIAIGGGAVLDMAGYAASIAHRGVRHIRIPTTVLSQNDSGVGVKNSINYFNKKNFVGNFAPPYAVINDSSFLTTLEDRDWRAGVSEAIKVALIKDAGFFAEIEKQVEALNKREMKPMEELIYRCAQLHMDHISGGDPFEMGSSRPLDFGHWAAHKLEQLTNYQLRHGEAVAVGIALDVVYSKLAGMLTEKETTRIIQLIQRLGFNLFVPELSACLDDPEHPNSILHGLSEFREHLGGKLTIMLLEGIGRGVEVHEMDEELIAQAVNELAYNHSVETLAG